MEFGTPLKKATTFLALAETETMTLSSLERSSTTSRPGPDLSTPTQ